MEILYQSGILDQSLSNVIDYQTLTANMDDDDEDLMDLVWIVLQWIIYFQTYLSVKIFLL